MSREGGWTPKEWGGAPTLWAITTPGEANLARNLGLLGFVVLDTLPRRKGYPKNGLLTLWVREFEVKEDENGAGA